jgi:CBS domain-containing protein
MKVRQIMSSPVLTLDPSTPLEEAATRMFLDEIVALPVVEDDTLIGIVGEADLYRAIAAARGVPMGGALPFDALGRPRVVSDVMRRGVLWVKASDEVQLAAQLLMRHARSLPVLDRGRVVGMVARRDVMSVLRRGSNVDLVRRTSDLAATRFNTRPPVLLIDRKKESVQRAPQPERVAVLG